MTRKECMGLIPATTAVFQRYVPCQQMPEIHPVTVKEFEKKRSELVERLQSRDLYQNNYS